MGCQVGQWLNTLTSGGICLLQGKQKVLPCPHVSPCFSECRSSSSDAETQKRIIQSMFVVCKAELCKSSGTREREIDNIAANQGRTEHTNSVVWIEKNVFVSIKPMWLCHHIYQKEYCHALRLCSCVCVQGVMRCDHSRCGLPWVTRYSSILFMAPMKKMSLSWVIAMVMRLHRRIGEHTDRQRGIAPGQWEKGREKWKKRGRERNITAFPWWEIWDPAGLLCESRTSGGTEPGPETKASLSYNHFNCTTKITQNICVNILRGYLHWCEWTSAAGWVCVAFYPITCLKIHRNRNWNADLRSSAITQTHSDLSSSAIRFQVLI